ncbi:MAG: porin family protein [Myxococcota bacterium]|nr:porin family protein [Myxococcota bacterium]
MRFVLVLVVVALSYGTASAQMVPPPIIEEPKMTVGGSLVVYVPQGDADDTSDTSLGIRGHFTYKFRPFLAGIGTFDYVFVNEDGDAAITYYNISAGARFIKPRPGLIEPYGEVLLGYHAFDAEGIDTETALGFRIGGGILYPFSNKLLANLALNYSAASFDVGFADVDVNALILEVGVAIKI